MAGLFTPPASGAATLQRAARDAAPDARWLLAVSDRNGIVSTSATTCNYPPAAKDSAQDGFRHALAAAIAADIDEALRHGYGDLLELAYPLMSWPRRGRPAKNAPARPAHERVRKLKGHPLCTVEEPRRPGLRQVRSKERSVDRTGGSAQRGPELGQFSHLAHPISLSKNVHASPTRPVRMVQRAFRRRKRRPPPSPR